MKLKKKQIQLLQMASEGSTLREIGEEQNHSEQYIKNCCARLRKLLQASNITHAVAIALRLKLIN
jgi:DNA-binding CsgD family transcriptional regulator